MWNVYHETLNSISRTNNACEGFHRALKQFVGSHKPTMWKFIEALKGMQRKTDFVANQYLSGSEPPKKKKKYRDYDEKLQTVVENYSGMKKLDYLLMVASNISYAM